MARCRFIKRSSKCPKGRKCKRVGRHGVKLACPR